MRKVTIVTCVRYVILEMKKKIIKNNKFIVFKSSAKELPPSFAINLDEFTIEPTQTVKLLGVTIDS